MSEGSILKYHGCSGNNEHRWLSIPFPNCNCYSSSFPGCKTALWQVCNEGAPRPVTSPAQWGQGTLTALSQWEWTHAQISASTRHGPAAVGPALDCKGLLTREQLWGRFGAWFGLPQHLFKTFSVHSTQTQLLCTQILMRPCHKILTWFGLEGDLEDHLLSKLLAIERDTFH